MGLSKFERRMMRLKGIKLPSRSLIDNDKEQKTGRPAKSIPNHQHGQVLGDVLDDEHETDKALDDIITGVVRSFNTDDGHKGHKLNVAVVRHMIDKLPIISTQSIEDNFGYSPVHARRYVLACKIVLQRKLKHDLRLLAKRAE